MKRKLLSLLLVTVMIVTSLPFEGFGGITSVFADELPDDVAKDVSVIEEEAPVEEETPIEEETEPEMSLMSTSATSGECGENLVWSFDEEGTLTVSGTGEMDAWTSSSSVPWNAHKAEIKNVVIGNNVTSIGSTAFYNCDSLTSVTIGNGVTIIGDDAFSNCDSLASIDIPDSVESIGDYAFCFCDSLTSVTIGNGVTSIGYSAFRDCGNLESIDIPDSVTSIGSSAFYDCDSLASIKVDENNQYYSNDERGVLFNKDKTTLLQYPTGNSATSYIIPDSVTSIGSSAFYDCDSLASVTIGSGVTSIGYYAFYACNNLANIKIPDSVTSIGYCAFVFCSSLASIDIPDSVTSIGESAFAYCDSLASVTIGSGVTSIGTYAFEDCDNLSTVYYNGTKAEWDKISIGSYNSCLTNVTLICTAIASGICGDGLKWILGNDGTLTISGTGDMTDWTYSSSVPWYSYRSQIKNVVINDAVTSIGEYAFYDCDSLASVTIGKGVTSIGSSAFEGCDNISAVYYSGTESDWNAISIGEYNERLTEAQRIYIVNVKLVYDDGSSVDIIHTPDTAIDPSYIPEKAHFTPVFYTDEAKTEKISIDTAITENTMLYLSYEPILYTHKFLDEDGTVLKTENVPYGSVITSPEAPEKAADVKYTYTFIGWEGFTEDMTQGEDELVFTAQYSAVINKYTHRFVDENGSVIKEETVEYGTLITPPEAPEKAADVKYSYTFIGWEGFTEGMTQGEDELVFTAKYSAVINKYTHRFVDENGNTIKEETVDYGSVITSPEAPEKAADVKYSYTFIGWEGFAEGMTQGEDELVFTAKYSAVINKYTHRFVDENGDTVKEETVEYGTLITPPEAPVKPSTTKFTYTFKEWQGFTEGMTQGEKELVFTAVYTATINKYTYTFTDGDTVLKQETADYGTVITPPETPSDKDPYAFAFWKDYNEGLTLVGDISFSAVYEYKTYTVSVYGESISFDITYGDNYTIAPLEKSGYIFRGYYTENNAGGKRLTDENGKSITPYDYISDITVYPYFEHELTGKMVMSGDTEAEIGESITLGVSFAANVTAQYLALTLGIPSGFSVSSVNAIDFVEVSKDSIVTKNGYTYITCMGIYDYNGSDIPKNQKITPFEIVFNVSTDVTKGEYEFTVSDSVLISSDRDIPVEKNVGTSVTVNPKLADRIYITGPSTIDAPTQFTATVLPSYTSDKTVVWSVDDNTVATVSPDGVVTPIKEGTVVLKASTADGSGLHATKTVEVVKYAQLLTLTTDIGNWNNTFDPEVYEYTIKVASDVSSISITPTFSGGVLRPNGEGLWISGRAKAFDLEYGTTTVTLVRQNVEGLADSTYTLKIVRQRDIQIVDGALFVQSGAEGNGTQDDPLGSLEEAIDAFNGKDGTVYIFGEYDITGFNNSAWDGMITVTSGDSEAVIAVQKSVGLIFNGDITFKDINFDVGQHAHLNPMGTKLIMDGGEGSEYPYMIHSTSYGNAIVEEAYLELKSGTIATVYVGGYSTSYANGCMGDSNIIINGATLKTLAISADSYMESQTGISIGGNLNIIHNSGTIGRISYKEKTVPEVMGAMNFVFNNGMQPPATFSYPNTAAKGVYIVRSGIGGTVMPTCEPGVFEIKADEGMVAVINGERVYDGNVTLNAGDTVVTWETIGQVNGNLSFEGAQIRTTGEQGLRFVFKLPKVFAENCTEYGSVVMPKKYLGDTELRIGVITEIDRMTYAAKKVPAVKIFKEDDDYIWYTACITHIKESNYFSEYVAVPYAVYKNELGEEETYYGDETENITVYSVAQAATWDENCDEKVKEYLEENIISLASKEYFFVKGTKNQTFGNLSPVSVTGGRDFLFGDRFDLYGNLICENETIYMDNIPLDGISDSYFLSELVLTMYKGNIISAVSLLNKKTVSASGINIEKENGVMTGKITFDGIPAYLDSTLIPEGSCFSNSVRFIEIKSEENGMTTYSSIGNLFDGVFSNDAFEGEYRFEEEFYELYNGEEDVEATAYDSNGDGCADIVFVYVPGLSSKFTDVSAENESLCEAVNTVVDYGIMNPTSETTFSPDELVTRQQMVAFIYRMMHKGETVIGGENTTPFTDLTDEAFFTMISWAYENGIISGKTDTTFAPASYITLQDAYVFLVHTLGYGKDKTLNIYECIEIAESLGFDKNISSSLGYTDRLTRGDIAILFASAFYANMNETTVASCYITDDDNEEITEYVGVEVYNTVAHKIYGKLIRNANHDIDYAIILPAQDGEELIFQTGGITFDGNLDVDYAVLALLNGKISILMLHDYISLYTHYDPDTDSMVPNDYGNLEPQIITDRRIAEKALATVVGKRIPFTVSDFTGKYLLSDVAYVNASDKALAELEEIFSSTQNDTSVYYEADSVELDRFTGSIFNINQLEGINRVNVQDDTIVIIESYDVYNDEYIYTEYSAADLKNSESLVLNNVRAVVKNNTKSAAVENLSYLFAELSEPTMFD